MVMISQEINSNHTPKNQSMVLTLQQQTSILQLMLAMFNTAPGAVNLTILGSQLQNGQSLASLAQSLSESALFFDKHYPTRLSPAEFAAAFVNDLIGNRASADDRDLLVDYITHQLIAGTTRDELIVELTSVLSSVPSSDITWGKASLYHNTHNVTKIVNYLLGNTFTLANKAVVVDHMLTQMATDKTFGEMIVWAIDTLAGVDHGNVVWGNAAVLFNNRTEVARYYSVHKAGAAIDRVTLQQILAKVTADSRTIAAAKAAVDNVLSNSNGFSDTDNSKDFQLDKVLKTKRRDSLSMPRGRTKPIELTI